MSDKIEPATDRQVSLWKERYMNQLDVCTVDVRGDILSLIARIAALTAEIATWQETAEQRANDCVEYQTEIQRLRSVPDARLRECLGKVAASKDNEATAYPVWYIVDPRQMLRPETGFAISMITGPFFSRESATETMNALKHRFRNPKVYCDSGHLSDDWKELYEASRAALSETKAVCE